MHGVGSILSILALTIAALSIAISAWTWLYYARDSRIRMLEDWAARQHLDLAALQREVTATRVTADAVAKAVKQR